MMSVGLEKDLGELDWAEDVAEKANASSPDGYTYSMGALLLPNTWWVRA
jgi:hypothetical protein